MVAELFTLVCALLPDRLPARYLRPQALLLIRRLIHDTGDIGDNSQTLINYFEGNGAAPCPPDENPAEVMIDLYVTLKHTC